MRNARANKHTPIDDTLQTIRHVMDELQGDVTEICRDGIDTGEAMNVATDINNVIDACSQEIVNIVDGYDMEHGESDCSLEYVLRRDYDMYGAAVVSVALSDWLNSLGTLDREEVISRTKQLLTVAARKDFIHG